MQDNQADFFKGFPLFTREEAARTLRMSISTLDHLSAARKIGFTRLGRRSYYRAQDIEKFLESRHVEPVEGNIRLNERPREKQLGKAERKQHGHG